MGPNVDSHESHEDRANVGEPFAIEPGACYLIEERKPSATYRLFHELAGNGRPAVVFSRQHPRILRRLYGVTCRVVWLCNALGEDCHNPAALQSLYERITTFMSENPESVVLLDGLEYLALPYHNGFVRTLTFVQDVNEFVNQHGSIVLFPVSPEALEERDLALLERELEIRDSMDIRAELDVRDVTRLLEPSRPHDTLGAT